MLYLRARHYAPGIGRFLTRDTWEGFASIPMSFNRWNYVEGNPINLADPTGRTPGFTCDWPNLHVPVRLNGKWWTIDNSLCQALDDPGAPLKLIEDFYRVVVANGLVAVGAPDAALLLRRSLDGKTTPYQVSESLGMELLELQSHKDNLKMQEQIFLEKLKIKALIMKCGETQSFEYSSPQLVIGAYHQGESLNVRFAMADHSAWFTWKGNIERKSNGSWSATGAFDRDLADYSDWHGVPHDYDGNGTLECNYGQCYKTAGFPLPGNIGTVTIPDDWMARLVIGGEASNPGFGIYYNTREWFWITAADWSTLPKIHYYPWRLSGAQYREPEHELQAVFVPAN